MPARRRRHRAPDTTLWRGLAIRRSEVVARAVCAGVEGRVAGRATLVKARAAAAGAVVARSIGVRVPIATVAVVGVGRALRVGALRCNLRTAKVSEQGRRRWAAVALGGGGRTPGITCLPMMGRGSGLECASPGFYSRGSGHRTKKGGQSSRRNAEDGAKSSRLKNALVRVGRVESEGRRGPRGAGARFAGSSLLAPDGC